MRVLMTSCPQYGHFFPLVPLAWALRAAGHEVRVAVPEQFTPVVAACGLPAVAVGGVVRTRDVMGTGDPELLSRWSSDPRGMHIDAVRTVSRFANYLATPVVALCRIWRPEVIVHPTLEFAGALAAAVTGVPSVSFSLGIALPSQAFPAVREELSGLYARWGLATGVPAPALRLDPWPPSLQVANPPQAQAIRAVPFGGPAVIPPWLIEPVTTPRACVTLGSVVPKTGGVGVLSPVLRALGRLGHEIVVVLPDETRRGLDALGPLPDRTRVAAAEGGPWLPVNLVAPTCDLVVHHGGAGTTLTSLAYGLPQLVLPHMADQFTVAERLADSGAALVIQPGAVTAAAATDALDRLLSDPGHRRAAGTLRTEIERQPSPIETVGHLEKLVEVA